MNMVNIGEAKAHLSEVLRRVEKGETILLARRNRPIAELRPIQEPRSELRPWGLCQGEFVVPSDFNDPVPDDVLDAFEGR
ncbi:MAG: type II toxin-antitoxin system Phd/YefM family antitoxin [Armatimonadetes bacterium]|nr:type II toxin-antitoxin system Phd/YefM family antitoxin [Armatimonadota bacterium]